MFGAMLRCDPALRGKRTQADGTDAEFCLLALQANTQAPLLYAFRYAVFEVKEFERT